MKIFVFLFFFIFAFLSCSDDDDGEDHSIFIDDNNGADYNPVIDPANFVETVDNPYFVLPQGRVWVYEGKNEDGETEKVRVEVTDDEKTVMGVKMTVVRDRVWEDGELVEDTHDWFAQDKDGNVWYFGEEVDNYEDGKLEDHEGAWEAGKNGAKPGIIMKASPKAGDAYRQEYLKGEAEDMGQVLSIQETVTTTLGTYKECIKIKDWTPLEADVVEHKFFCKEVGGLVLEQKVAGESGKLEIIEFVSE